MPEKRCAICARVTTSWQEWFRCSNCGTSYCPQCYDVFLGSYSFGNERKMQQEPGRQGQIVAGVLGTRYAKTPCPRCEAMLIPF